MRLFRSALVLVLAYANLAAAAEPPLRAGVLDDAPPYVMKDAHGALTGFTIDLFRLVAARMQRQIDYTTAPQRALFDGLQHAQYDVLPGPIAATPERAGDMLLLQGYAWSEYQFGVRRGDHLAALADLHGQAVLEKQADASLSGSQVQGYAAAQNANYLPALSLPETRTHQTAAVRRSDTELRDEMEDALRCLKMDGTVARLSKQWFGRSPEDEDLENLVVPGYGVPGLAGYDPKPRKTRC